MLQPLCLAQEFRSFKKFPFHRNPAFIAIIIGAGKIAATTSKANFCASFIEKP